MEFKIDKDILQKSLLSVEGIINPKNSDTVLANVLLEAKSNKIFLTTSDSDINIKSYAESEIIAPGAVMLPAKKFANIIRSLNPGPITVKLNENYSVKIATPDNKTNFTIVGSESNEYPNRMQMPQIELFSLPQPLFKSMMQKTFFAAANNDDSRFVFNGVFFEANEENLVFVATDGKRLAYIQNSNIYKVNLEEGVIIPSKIISELHKLLISDNEILFNIAQNQIYFKLNNIEISCRLIQGKFPDYKKVIPNKTIHSVSIERSQFIGALKRVSLMASDAAHQVKLSFNKNNLRIEAQTPDIGSAQEDLTIEKALEANEMGFNSNYLLDAIKEIETENIEFKFSDSEMPAIVKAIDNDNYISVIMPLKIN